MRYDPPRHCRALALLALCYALPSLGGGCLVRVASLRAVTTQAGAFLQPGCVYVPDETEPFSTGVGGSFVVDGTGATLDLTALTAGPAVVLEQGASLELRNLTLLLPPMPDATAAAPNSLLAHLFSTAPAADSDSVPAESLQQQQQLMLQGVIVMAASCSDLAAFTTVLCDADSWTYSTAVRVEKGVVKYGDGEGGAMALSTYSGAGVTDVTGTWPEAAASPSARLVDAQLKCSLEPQQGGSGSGVEQTGPPAPWLCLALPVAGAAELAAALQQLDSIERTALLSLTADVSLEGVQWDVPSVAVGLTLALYGRPVTAADPVAVAAAAATQLDFAGRDFITISKGFLLSGQVKFNDLALVGLPYPAYFTQATQLTGLWCWAVDTGPTYMLGWRAGPPMLACMRCTLILADDEVAMWARFAAAVGPTWSTQMQLAAPLEGDSTNISAPAIAPLMLSYGIDDRSRRNREFRSTMLLPRSLYVSSRLSAAAARLSEAWPLGLDMGPEAAPELFLANAREDRLLLSVDWPMENPPLAIFLSGRCASWNVIVATALPGSLSGRLLDPGDSSASYVLGGGDEAACTFRGPVGGRSPPQAQQQVFWSHQGVASVLIMPPTGSLTLQSLFLTDLASTPEASPTDPVPSVEPTAPPYGLPLYSGYGSYGSYGSRGTGGLSTGAGWGAGASYGGGGWEGGVGTAGGLPYGGAASFSWLAQHRHHRLSGDPNAAAADRAAALARIARKPSFMEYVEMPPERPLPEWALPLVSLAMPLWYFEVDRTLAASDAQLLLHNVTLVVPDQELQLLLRLLAAAGTLPATRGGSSGSRRLRSRRQLAACARGTPYGELLSYAAASQVEWYREDAVLFSYTQHYGWRGTQVLVTSTLPPDAPQDALPVTQTLSPVLETCEGLTQGGLPVGTAATPPPVPVLSPTPPPPKPAPTGGSAPLPSTSAQPTSPLAPPLEPPTILAADSGPQVGRALEAPSSDTKRPWLLPVVASVAAVLGVGLAACVVAVVAVLVRRRRRSKGTAVVPLKGGALQFEPPQQHGADADAELGTQIDRSGTAVEVFPPMRAGGGSSSPLPPPALPTPALRGSDGSSTDTSGGVCSEHPALGALLAGSDAADSARIASSLMASRRASSLAAVPAFSPASPRARARASVADSSADAQATSLPSLEQSALALLLPPGSVQPLEQQAQVQRQGSKGAGGVGHGAPSGDTAGAPGSAPPPHDWSARSAAATGAGIGAAPADGGSLMSTLRTVDIDLCLAGYFEASRSEQLQLARNSSSSPKASSLTCTSGDRGSSGESRLAATINKTRAQLALAPGGGDSVTLLGVLGRGASGVVHLGVWRGLQVAVKVRVLHEPLLADGRNARQQAVLEAAASMALDHPNVVATFAYSLRRLGVEGASDAAAGADGDVQQLLIVNELCEGGSLREALASGLIPGAAAGAAAALLALYIAADVAAGMRHVHSRDIVHGDLSPSNVLLTCRAADEASPGADPPAGDCITETSGSASGTAANGGAGSSGSGGRSSGNNEGAMTGSSAAAGPGAWLPSMVAKVTDFGLSVRMRQDETHVSGRYQGTAAYTAPEVLATGHLSKAADVFSFGALLLALVRGREVEGDGAQGNGAAAAGPAALLPPQCPAQLRWLVADCMALAPAVRPSFAEVHRRLGEVIASTKLLWPAGQQMERAHLVLMGAGESLPWMGGVLITALKLAKLLEPPDTAK